MYCSWMSHFIFKSQKEISPFELFPWMVHALNSMIMTFCFYARILEDLFQFDTRCSHTSVAYGRPITTKTSNVTYLTLTRHQRYLKGGT